MLVSTAELRFFTIGFPMFRHVVCLFVAAVLMCLVPSPSFAGKNASIEPKLTKIGSPVVNESFDGKLGNEFRGVKGEWKIIDGVLVAREIAADKHAAVMNFQKKNRNSVVRFSFKLDDETTGFHFSLNHKGGHLFRAIIAANKLTISLDKNKKDPKSKAVALASAKGSFAQGKWYTMQVEMVGDRVLVQTDNGISAEAKHEKLNTDKPNYRFVMRSKTLVLDDLYVWEVK